MPIPKEEIEKAARAAQTQKILDNTDFDEQTLNSFDDDKIDELYGLVSMSLDEKINNIMDCMFAINAPKEDLEESVKIHTGLKLKEAQKIIKEKLEEKKRTKSTVDRIIELI